MNISGGPWNIVLDWSPDPPHRGGGKVRDIWPIVDLLLISETAEAPGAKVLVRIKGWEP